MATNFGGHFCFGGRGFLVERVPSSVMNASFEI